MKILISILVILSILIISTNLLAIENNNKNNYLERVQSPSDYREIYNKFRIEDITTSQEALNTFAISTLIFIIIVMIILGVKTGI